MHTRLMRAGPSHHYTSAKLRSKDWKGRTAKDIHNRVNYLIEILGNKPLQEITRADMRSFVDILRQLPPNHTKSAQYVGKSITEIIAMRPEQTLNVKTVNTIIQAVGSLFEWCVHERVLGDSPAKGLQVKDTRHAIDLREPFSREDLERIFAHPKFAQGTFKNPSYFWIPLIGLFTGMRLEEIAQLFCADIYQDKVSDLWVIDVNDKGKDELGHEKTLKTKNAHRLIPIHKTLRELGLLDYRAHIEKGKYIRLFPELKMTEKVTQLGKQPGKQFKSVVEEALDNADKKSFHSLRHSFSDFYKQRGMHSDYFRQLYGHEIRELAARQYGSKFPPESGKK